MRKVFLVTVFALVASGCRGVNRLMNGPESNDNQAQSSVTTSVPPLGSAPSFNIPTPSGYQLVVFHGELPLDGLVQVQASADCLLKVFLKDRTIGQWFQLGDRYSQAFWYSFDPASGVVQYKGQHLELKEFCVYEYTLVTP